MVYKGSEIQLFIQLKLLLYSCGFGDFNKYPFFYNLSILITEL